ncbi:MAG: hypothetical protein AABX11_00480 [Nanoarchaeota archaeon]
MPRCSASVGSFTLGGTGLGILFNSRGDIGSIVGGFALIGIAVAVIKKVIEDD